MEFLLNRFAAGFAIGLALYVLRSSIDRRKGFVVEAAAVVLPILIASVLLSMLSPQFNWTQFGLSATPFIQFLFTALPFLVAMRLIERFQRNETPQIVDLFRITTVISLATFTYTTLAIPAGGVASLPLIVAFLVADSTSLSRKKPRQLAIALTLGFLMSIALRLTLGVAITEVLLFTSQVKIHGFSEWLAALAMIIAVVLAPLLADAWLTNASGLHRIAHRLSAWRFSFSDPKDQIFCTNVMQLWKFRSGICYLNHGSFGAVPLRVSDQQRTLRSECEREPMDFLVRQLETRWMKARFQLAVWLGTQEENLAFCENATAAMNEIASWFPLQPGDEVLVNDHEYGAVRRIWQRACDAAGARLVQATLPMPFTTHEAITESILQDCNERTKLVIFSHITSPTAVRLPVEDLCTQLHQRGIASCIDGPHALLQEPLRLYRLGCDFYTASCHKWLCAPLGSGFVYVAPQWHSHVQPARLSWGRLGPRQPESWTDELLWTGSRDFSAYLSVPKAIQFFEKFPLEKLDQRNHELACYARRRLLEIPGCEPVTPEGREWFGWMVGVWLPDGLGEETDYATLQQRLFDRHGIEVPIVHFNQRYLVRVSCHLYINSDDIDRLVRSILSELRQKN